MLVVVEPCWGFFNDATNANSWERVLAALVSKSYRSSTKEPSKRCQHGKHPSAKARDALWLPPPAAPLARRPRPGGRAAARLGAWLPSRARSSQLNLSLTRRVLAALVAAASASQRAAEFLLWGSGQALFVEIFAGFQAHFVISH